MSHKVRVNMWFHNSQKTVWKVILPFLKRGVGEGGATWTQFFPCLLVLSNVTNVRAEVSVISCLVWLGLWRYKTCSSVVLTHGDLAVAGERDWREQRLVQREQDSLHWWHQYVWTSHGACFISWQSWEQPEDCMFQSCCCIRYYRWNQRTAFCNCAQLNYPNIHDLKCWSDELFSAKRLTTADILCADSATTSYLGLFPHVSPRRLSFLSSWSKSKGAVWNAGLKTSSERNASTVEDSGWIWNNTYIYCQFTHGQYCVRVSVFALEATGPFCMQPLSSWPAIKQIFQTQVKKEFKRAKVATRLGL